MDIDAIIDNVYVLPEKSRERLKANISEITYPRGHLLFKVNKISSRIYFIKTGIVRAYAETPDNEITFWFGKEGDTVISMKSYVYDQKGYENIELLEPCELYQTDAEDLRKLFNEDIHIANWGRKFAEQELVKVEERLIFRQCRTAMERYKELISTDPALLQRVQLGHIASYLGMTQVSLSRIRSELK
ncbi:Crp/Fnr family transcriptional regulator [Chitinophaga agrisoli]|uniref:Crp/Fnr family transcriptional regulator n=1 Tax=Chitinophaga agrisoli TaxID=2607653 RepID=A0A5B2VW52_9BACT|nr:Crp/Fnr family transcriptional regulator [Chitinophaga agrisoli]KAA2243355.1 Crp/Fnr family transcriptional regulator [Chitinophaga agrisoli]